MKRSEKFNYFTQDKDPVEKRKKLLRKIWKWFKVTILVLILGTTLTGCVQSFVLKTSNNTGAGFEFTRSREHIGPKVTVLQDESKQLELPASGNETETTKINIDTYKVNTNVNPYISDETVLSGIRKQLNGESGHLGYYGRDNSYSSAIVLNNDLSTVYNKNNKYLVAAIRSQKASAAELPDYEFVNDIKDIYFFNYYYNWASSNRTFIKYLKTEIKDGETETNTTNASEALKDGLISVTWVSGLSKVASYTDEKISEVKATTDAEKYQKQQKLLLNQFNRDVLQLFYDKTFSADSDFVKHLGKDPSLFLKEKIDQAKQSVAEHKKVLFTLTAKEEVLLKKYIELMSSWFALTGYLWTENNLVQSSQIVESAQDTDAVKASEYTEKYNYDKNLIKIGEPVNKLAFQDNTTLLNVSSWGQAWKYGPFYGFFVYPTAFVINEISRGIGSLSGWGTIIVLFIVTILIRSVVFGLTFKSTAKMSAQEELKSKRAAIEAKYVGFENNKAMKARKAQELQALNKKYNITFFDTVGSQFMTLPIFITMWRAIQIIPSIKSTQWLGINFGSTSYQKVGEGQYVYLIVLILAILIQLISSLLPILLNRKRFKERTSIAQRQALKKQERTQHIMVIVFTLFVIMFTAGVQIYWIFTGIFTIIQTLVMWRVKKTQWFKERYSLKALARK